ncbi:MAG: endopeptidase [Leptothrix ochracea]|uniref:Bbp19 family protein n=1 Tax=Leptothrix ochracea TaxID=735331 RepID=UPI0034E2686B
MDAYDPTEVDQNDTAQQDAQKRARDAVRVDADDFKWIVSNKRGRRFAYRLLDRCGVFRSSFTGNSTTFFNEGQRNIGLHLLGMLNEHAPEAYSLMLKEHNDHERSTNERPSTH